MPCSFIHRIFVIILGVNLHKIHPERFKYGIFLVLGKHNKKKRGEGGEKRGKEEGEKERGRREEEEEREETDD